MPPNIADPTTPIESAEAARRLAQLLEARGVEYGLGGALALGYWGAPRGTLDVDITLFVPPAAHQECVRLLMELGCQIDVAAATASLAEHGFCRTHWGGVPLDVFLPTLPLYTEARLRRRRVPLGDTAVSVWDAETLSVFKMMFFRRKDLADIEQMLRTQGAGFDRSWVRTKLLEIYGRRDPRLAQWDELVVEIDGTN